MYICHFYFPASRLAVATGVVPSPRRFLPLMLFSAQRIQQSRCSSISHRVLLTHALALSASQLVHKKESLRIHTNTHSGGLELTELTYTRLEDKPIRHRGDRLVDTWTHGSPIVLGAIDYNRALVYGHRMGGPLASRAFNVLCHVPPMWYSWVADGSPVGFRQRSPASFYPLPMCLSSRVFPQFLRVFSIHGSSLVGVGNNLSAVVPLL